MDTKKNKLSIWQIYGYGLCGMFVNTFYLGYLAFTRLYFLTDVLQLNPYIAATINSATVWINVGTMLLGGIFVDGTNMKWGRYRSWVLIGGIVFSISFPLMFTNFGLPQGVASALFVILFIVQSLGYNCLWVAERALIGSLSSNSDDANGLSMSANQMGSVASLLYGVVHPFISGIFMNFSNSYGWIGLLYGVLVLAGTVGMFLMARNYDLPQAEIQKTNAPKEGKMTLGEMMKSFKGPVIPFFISMCLCNCHVGFFMTIVTHFSTYVLKNPNVVSYAVSLGSAGSLIGVMIAKVYVDRVGKKSAFVWSTIVTGILYILIAYLGGNAIPFLVIRVAINVIGCVSGLVMPTFGIDLADYKVMHGEPGARAFIQSLTGVTIRIGTALSTMVASFGLAIAGYNAAAEPSAAVIKALTNIMAFGPGLVCIASALCFIFYKVDEKELDEFRRKQLAERQGSAEAAE